MARYVVTTGADRTDAGDGVLSLREAITLAHGNPGDDRIVFARGVSTVALRDGLEIDAAARLTIVGDRNGDGLADVTFTTDGEIAASMFEISAPSSLEIVGVRFADYAIDIPNGARGASGRLGSPDGLAGGSGAPGGDGAALLNHGTLSLVRVQFDGSGFVDAGDGGRGGTGGEGSTPAPAGTARNGRAGGDGGRGGDGAEGGHGAGAVVNRGTLRLADVGVAGEIEAAGGRGGWGGLGGIGGDGGRGGDGADNVVLFGVGGNGGNGGAGGRAGDGGDGAGGGAAAGGFLNTGTVAANTPLAVSGLVEGYAGPAGSGGVSNYVVNPATGARSNGNGGAGGAGGSGGVLGSDGDPGSRGPDGGFGADGAAGRTARGLSFWLSDGAEPRPDTFNTLVFAHAAKGNIREGGALEFSVVRLGSDDTSFTVGWELDPGRGCGRGDLDGGALGGRVEFSGNGPDIRTVRIATGRDGRTEGDEGFRFRLTDIEFTETTTERAGFGTAAVRGRLLDRDGATDGADTLLGTPLADVIDGGRGADLIRGFGGDDTLVGSGGNDRIFGGRGADELSGGRGADLLVGGKGADLLSGGLGPDVLKGGPGADTFRFASNAEAGRGANRDVIRDFERNRDVIDVSKMDANTERPGDQANEFIGAAAFTGQAGVLRYAGGLLQGDDDGDRIADFEIALKGAPGLSESDFIL